MRGISLAGQADGHLSGLRLAMLTRSAEKSASPNESLMRAKFSQPVAVAGSFKSSSSRANHQLPTGPSSSSRRVSGGGTHLPTKYLFLFASIVPSPMESFRPRTEKLRGGEEGSSTC